MRSMTCLCAIAAIFLSDAASAQTKVADQLSATELGRRLDAIDHKLTVLREGGYIYTLPGESEPLVLTKDELTALLTHFILAGMLKPEGVVPLVRQLRRGQGSRMDDLEEERNNLLFETMHRDKLREQAGPTASQVTAEVNALIDLEVSGPAIPSREQVVQGAASALTAVQMPRRAPTNQEIFDAFSALGQGIGAIAGTDGSPRSVSTPGFAPSVPVPLLPVPGPASAGLPGQLVPLLPAPGSAASTGAPWAGRYDLGGGVIMTVVGEGAGMTAQWQSDLQQVRVGGCSVEGDHARCSTAGSYTPSEATITYNGMLDMNRTGDRIAATHTLTSVNAQWRTTPYDTPFKQGATFQFEMARIN